MSGKDVVKILRSHGWTIERTKGSHQVMKKGNLICPVPVHGNKDLAVGTFKSIEKITGVKLK